MIGKTISLYKTIDKVKYDPEKHHRMSIRLEGYDNVNPGMYFVTLCEKNRECLFGCIENDEMKLNGFGRIVQETWDKIPERFNNTSLDTFGLMPNHLHGTILRNECRGEVTSPLREPTLGQIIAYFKYQSTKRINEMRNTPDEKLWQRNYFDRIIRNEMELNRIREYIIYNPLKWESDKENPKNRIK